MLIDSALRDLIQEVISASPEYMQKERVRKSLQDEIVQAVRDGTIIGKDTLDWFLKSLDTKENALAMTSLKHIPFEVWDKLAAKTH